MTTQQQSVRSSGAHYVYLELKRRILELELPPGERLFEPALAASLNVSRTPLREAVRRLIAESLLEQQPTGGVVVPTLDPREIAELYQVRASLEGLMAEAACTRWTTEDLQDLRGLLDRNEALVRFPEDAMRAGKAFHAEIARISDNTWAARLHDQVSSHMQRYRMFTNHTQERRDAALQEHRAIFDALAARDCKSARSLAESHVAGARDAAIRAVSGDSGR